jgi:hypothetical protein
VGALKNTLEPANGATEVSRTAFAIMLFIVVLLLGAIVSLPLRYIFDVDIYVVLGVSLTLAMLWLLAALDGGWFGSTPGMMMLGLVVAVPVRLVFDTGFVSVLGISVVVGLVHPLLKGRVYREEARRRQREARLREPEQEQLAKEQEVRSYRPSRQDSDIERVVPTRPHELRAMLYEE